jgi:O-Antigen ligase
MYIHKSGFSRLDLVSKTTTWVLILSTVGYPITACTAVFLAVPSTPINTGLRMVVLGLSLISLLLGLYNKTSKTPKNNKFIFFLGFWVIYSLRILYDVSLRGIRYDRYDAQYVYTFVFGVCFIPALAVLINARYIIAETLTKYLFFTTALSNILIFLLVVQTIQAGTFDPTKVRATLNTEDGATINPILIGLYGEILSLFVLTKILLEREKKKYHILIPLLMVGLANLVLGASRGPVLGFLVVLIILIRLHFRNVRINSAYMFRLGVVLVLTISLSAKYIIPLFESQSFSLFQRLTEFSDSRSGAGKTEEVRDYLIAESWQMFLDSPIIGNQFVTKIDNYFPHNFILEVLMATGIVGAFFFSGLFINLFNKVRLIIKNYNYHVTLLLILFLIHVVANLTSGGLFLSNEFWMVCAVISSVSNIRFLKKTSINGI